MSPAQPEVSRPQASRPGEQPTGSAPGPFNWRPVGSSRAEPNAPAAANHTRSATTPGGAYSGASGREPGTTPTTPAPLSAYRSPSSPGYGTPQPRAAEKSKQRRGQRDRQGRGARAAVAVLAVLLPLGIVGGAAAGYFLANQVQSYDERKLEREVAEVLRDDFGLADVSKVNCPAWVKVQQGESFQCEFEYSGATQTVTVTQGAQSGQLIVGAPDGE